MIEKYVLRESREGSGFDLVTGRHIRELSVFSEIVDGHYALFELGIGRIYGPTLFGIEPKEEKVRRRLYDHIMEKVEGKLARIKEIHDASRDLPAFRLEDYFEDRTGLAEKLKK